MRGMLLSVLVISLTLTGCQGLTGDSAAGNVTESITVTSTVTPPPPATPTDEATDDTDADAASVRFEMSSNPFPLSVGNSQLLIALTDADGEPITDAALNVTGQMLHEGMLPMRGRASAAQDDGVYRVPMVWSMPGDYVVTVVAQNADTGEAFTEEFEVFVYPVPTRGDTGRITFKTLRERQLESTSTEKEYRIIIPLGTWSQVAAGQGSEFIPDEIRLSVSGQNTLFIQNDDIVDHTIGPFFVRAGESIRQEFKKPDIYQGTCSIRHDATLNIIVEE